MNIWLDRLKWLAVITLFGGLSVSKALISIGVGLLILSTMLHLILSNKKPSWRASLPILGLGAFFVFQVCSVFWSANLMEGLDEIYRQHAFVSIPICFWILSDWLSPKIHKLLSVFIAVCTFHSLLTILLFLLPESTVADLAGQFGFLQPYPELTDRLKFGLYTPMIERLNFAYLIGFGILYLLYCSLANQWKLSYLIPLLILTITFLLIGARGAQVALLVAGAVGACSYMIDLLKCQNLTKELYRQRLVSGLTVILIAIVAIPYLSFKMIPAVQKRYAQMQWELRLIDNGGYLQEEYQYFTSLSRIRAWTNAWNIAKSNPIIGVGIGDYGDAMIVENASYNDKVPVHNQNFFLYIWGCSGLLTLLAWLFGLGHYVRTFFTSKSGIVRHLVLSYVIFICISCLIDAFLKYHIGSSSVILFLSALFLLNIQHRLDVA